MAYADWDAPRTEDGLQQVLRRLVECRAAGERDEEGYGLLHLSFLVKWVRSDTDLPPFGRSQELAIMALGIFRQTGNEEGLVRALVAATALADAAAKEAMLSEAESLAERLGDDHLLALALSARARAIGLSDPAKATALHGRSLKLYRRMGHQQGQAQCLFGLAVTGEDVAERRDWAMEAARLYRLVGEYGEAARSVSIALMNAREIQPLTELEPLVREGLEDALAAQDPGLQKGFHEDLAEITLAQGQIEEAEKHRKQASELQAADGLTSYERWLENVEFTEVFIGLARLNNQPEAEKMFREELARLKAENRWFAFKQLLRVRAG